MSTMTSKKIVSLPGDGIGPEVTHEALNILTCVCQNYGCELSVQEMPFGGASLEKHGSPLTDETLTACKNASAVFLGAVGDPRWDDTPKEKRPEAGLLDLRKALDLYANLRPIKVYKPLIDASTLKANIIRDVDILIVRELTGGIYFGEPRFTSNDHSGEFAVDTMEYCQNEIERIAETAFMLAGRRNHNVCSVDKANVLDTSRLWRKTITAFAKKQPQIALRHLLVDNCAMQLVRNPSQFDVMMTSNMFGDILSDEASMLTGSIGMLPSASLGSNLTLFEPVHGSAPDIAGQGKANPIAAIASAGMLCRYAFEMEEAADKIEQAISKTLSNGYRTADIHANRPEEKLVSTAEMGSAIMQCLQANLQTNPA